MSLLEHRNYAQGHRSRRRTGAVIALVALAASGLAVGLAIEGDCAPARVSADARTAAGAKAVTPEHLESVVRYNGTDDDAQVLFLAKDEERAMSKVTISGPDGEAVIADRTIGGGRIGQDVADIRTSQHALAAIKRAYPPGKYRWTGEMASGKPLSGTSRLDYDLLAPPRITSPADEATGVATTGVRVEWRPVRRAEAIFIEVEDDNSARGRELLVRLDGDATSLTLPDELLKPNTEYAVELKALAGNGNQSAADYAFTTSG
jgi:hypothetical protein